MTEGLTLTAKKFMKFFQPLSSETVVSSVSPLYCWRNTGEKFKIYPYAEIRNTIFNLLPMWRSQVGGVVEI